MLSLRAAAIKNEIVNDPAGVGYMSSTDNTLWRNNLAKLNSPTHPALQPVTAAQGMTWAATGPYAKIVDAANQVGHPARSSCLVVEESLRSGTPIHMELPAIQDMFTGWVAAGVITSAEHDALVAVAMQPVSRAVILGLGYVTDIEFATVFFNDDGSAK